MTDIVDRILIDNDDPRVVQQLKEAFALGNLTHDQDFANILSHGVASFQNLNWDPAVSDNTFYDYCDAVTQDFAIYPIMEEHRDSVKELLDVAGYGDKLDTLLNRTMN